MQDRAKRPKILIISGYHTEETFAVEVGERLLENISVLDMKVVRYTRKPDKGKSNSNLRRFVKRFDPVISPIILHGDDDLGLDMAIIYCARSRKERRKALKPLLDFAFRNSHDIFITGGRFLIPNAKYGLIEIELNSRLGLQKAVNLVESFSRYLLKLYLEKRVKL